MSKYHLKCLSCGKEYEDDHFRMQCDAQHEPSLLRSVYIDKKLTLHKDKPGMFRFYDYLPVERTIEAKGVPVTYKSTGLAEYLGLENLYIIFNGYWPEKNARMDTASFKELEAPSVLARISEHNRDILVVASAGNTGRAFANICSSNKIPLVLVVPEVSVKKIWSIRPFNECVKLICAGGNSDYFNAISLAGAITQLDGFFPEGGARNVGRRDGMATTVLDAATTIGKTPDHYFQAIGSGTGGIAAWESYLRLTEDGSYGNGNMKLHLSQNHPFTPMTDAWIEGSRDIAPMSEEEAKEKIHSITASVLTNRKPPYSITGGVYDVLNASSGHMYSVTNPEIAEAMDLFEERENIDICSAAGVAAGSLIKAVKNKTVNKEDHIALNITGGGENKLRREHDLHFLNPVLSISEQEIGSDGVTKKLENMFAAVL
ncbi:MAG TPA: cysteate synthase [Spirochaetes bacterium]|nr:cysteate synthase [Spirochaetota bacterium]